MAVVLAAELPGRCGHFPEMLCLRPIQNRIRPQCEVAGILNIHTTREEARKRRL